MENKKLILRNEIWKRYHEHCEKNCCSDCEYNVMSCESDFYDCNIEQITLDLNKEIV